MRRGRGTQHHQPSWTAVGQLAPRLVEGLRPTMVRSVGADSADEVAPPVADRDTAATLAWFDFDLAEFPLFRFSKRPQERDRSPLCYTDTITGPNSQRITREWRVFPGHLGFGGATTQVLLFDLLQLYIEQGAKGSQIEFGTLHAIFRRRGLRNPSTRDYARLRRDMDILRGYDFQCKNAFWHAGKRSYVDMNWRLFGSVFYFRPQVGGVDDQLPYGFIEASPVLQHIARSRGFFSLGVPPQVFYNLKPLEQRLVIYLAKKFSSQTEHRRFVDGVATALPIEAARPQDVRSTLAAAAEGLLQHKLPLLRSFRFDRAKDGRWLAVFTRGARPKASSPQQFAAPPLDERSWYLVDQLVEVTGAPDDLIWWTQCVRRLGPGPVERALGQFREARQAQHVRNPPGLMTKILKDIAREVGVGLKNRE